jgi:hypothetical protein
MQRYYAFLLDVEHKKIKSDRIQKQAISESFYLKTKLFFYLRKIQFQNIY